MPERYSPREAGVEVGSFLHDYYKQMIEKKKISESALKSTIDPDYKPKGKKLLSNYRTTKITEEFIKANKKDYPFLKHIRTSPDTESCMWLDGKNPVAVVVVRKESEIYTWITSIDIFPRYRGYGLSYQILDYATKKMGANCLTVAKDNEIAKKVYDKYGFRELIMGPKERHNDKVTYMALPGTLKESAYMNPQSVVYFTRDISPESLVKIYEALGIDLPGKVMVKISSGEPGGHHFLSPDLIAPLVKKVNGTICDANTAYEGKRHRTRDHRQTMHDHGFDAIAPTDILDATGDKAVPVRNGYHLEEVRIGNQTDLYDSVLVLSHFKGHALAGFGGALKNVAIGMASAAGKALVHTAGKSDKTIDGPQQDFLRSMVDSVSGITSYIGKDKFVYINIANNLSVDCDCDAHPAPPTMEDIGIFASTDPVAVDQACIDAVYFAEDSKDLIARIKRQTGLNILKYASEHGIGSRRYQIVDLDRPQNESFAPCERLKDAIDNIFSHNALVQLWTPVIHDTNGERYNYKLWDGEAWKIPEEYLDLDILSINDIADDEHLGYINIIIDSDYVPMEESAKNEKLYPVYITLFSNDTNFGKLIRKATGSEYSHATVALDPTMNNMYSFSDIPYNEARFFCAGFVRESIWSPEYTKNRHFRVLVTFVNKAGRDKIQKKIDYFINNFEKYNYNDIGLVQYYFKFKNTKKHNETKKMRWFCSEFVSAMVNASDETEGFENILASPQDLLGKPNVIDLGKFTIPEFNEEELVRKTRAAEKEFRKHANLSKSVVNESADEWLYELIDESALNEIFNKAKSKKPKFDERQVQKYTFNLDWKLLYEKFKELFPKNDPAMRFDLFGVIVRYFLIPTKAAAVNVTQQIIDQMVKIASFVKNGFIKLIDAVSSLIFFQGEDGDDVMRYPDGPMHEAALNEYMHTSQIDSREERDELMAKYGLRQGGYGQRTSKEDEDRMKKSAEWEKKIPLKQRKKIYREDGHPEELIPSHEEVRDPVDDCLPIAEAASDSEIEKLLELNRKLNKYDYIDNSTGKNYKLRSPSQFESDHGGVCWDFVVYQADQFKKLGITNYKTYYVVFDKAPNYPTHTFQIIKLNNQYVYFESSYIRIRGIWMAKSSNDLISFVINTMIKQTKSLKDARYEVREYNPSEGKLIGMDAVEFMNYMNEKKFASFRYIKDPKITKINKPEDLNETAAVADDTKGDDNNFHNGNKLIHWYDGWTADGCQFDLEGVAEGEPGAYRFEVDIDSQDEWMGTIHNLNNPDRSLITEAMERVLVDPTNKAMVQKYRDLGYEFIPGVKNRGKAQPMFKTDRSKPDKLYPVYVVLFYSGTALGKLIKAAAGPHFSHAAISFTENLTEMYSFGRKSGLNVEAFVVDSIENEAYQRPDTQYAIYMVPATAEQYDRMKERIQWFIKNAAKFKYNFSGLFKNYLGISDNPKYRYFCSQFVADILNVADPSKPYFADPSLVTPENFIYTTFAQYVVSGPLSEFDPNHVKKISQLLLARETKNRNATFKNESASIPYSNPLTIRFTNDKIPIVTKSHFNRISTIYNDAEKVINNADSDDRLVTDTMCKLTYAIEIMDRYLTKGLGKKDELYRDMIQLRSKILKLVMKGHKRMMTSSENYNFQEIYNKSKYADVPTASTVIGEELRTLL